jgi:hypothetical protein
MSDLDGQERETPVEAVGAVVLYLQECRRAKLEPSESEIAHVAVQAADAARAALDVYASMPTPRRVQQERVRDSFDDLRKDAEDDEATEPGYQWPSWLDGGSAC